MPITVIHDRELATRDKITFLHHLVSALLIFHITEGQVLLDIHISSIAQEKCKDPSSPAKLWQLTG